MTTLLRVSGDVLEYIKAGDWTTIKEIARHIDLTEKTLVKILDFLFEFDFIEFDSDKNRIRITGHGKKLLKLPEI